MTEIIKEDKRKKTSSANLAKARQTKIDKLKQKKEEKASKYEIVDDSDSDTESSSDEDSIVITSKKKQIKKPPVPISDDPIKKELAELRDMISNLSVKRTRKTKPKRSKQVIQIVNPPPEPKKVSPEAELIKQQMLLKFK